MHAPVDPMMRMMIFPRNTGPPVHPSNTHINTSMRIALCAGDKLM